MTFPICEYVNIVPIGVTRFKLLWFTYKWLLSVWEGYVSGYSLVNIR